MKETVFTKATKEAISVTLKAIDQVIEEEVETLADVGNPEKLIGKKYEEWTPQDFEALTNIYGREEPNVLSRFIFNKEYDKVLEMEKEL